MNKGFLTYYKQGIKDTKMLLKKKSNFFKLFVYFIFILCGTIFVPHLMEVSLVRLAKKVHEDSELSFEEIFNFSDEPKNIYNIIVTGLLKCLVFLTGIIVCLLIGGLFYFLGQGISVLLFNNPLTPISFVLGGIGGISLLIFIYFYVFYLSHTSFLLSEGKNITSSKAIVNSFNLSKKGKLVLFLSFLIPNLFLLVIAFLGVVLTNVFLSSQGGLPSYVSYFLFCLILIILILVVSFILPLLVLNCLITNYLLRKDLYLGDKEHNFAYVNVGVNTSKLNHKYLNLDNVENNLNSLFDVCKTSSPTTILDKEDDVTSKENASSTLEENKENVNALDSSLSLDSPTTNETLKDGE